MLVQRHFPKLPPRFTPPTIRVVGVLQARTSESFVGYPKFSTGFVRKEEITAIVWLDAAYCKHFCHLEKVLSVFATQNALDSKGLLHRF